MNQLLGLLQGFFIFIVPILFIPLIIGVIILRRAPEGNDGLFSRYAGWMTLKPLIATPFWWVIFFTYIPSSNSHSIPLQPFLGLLPGAIITVIIVSHFKSVLFGTNAKFGARLLLVLDCVRWINSGLILASSSFKMQADLSHMINVFIIITAFLLPTIFAFIAFGLSRDEAKKRKCKIKNDV